MFGYTHDHPQYVSTAIRGQCVCLWVHWLTRPSALPVVPVNARIDPRCGAENHAGNRVSCVRGRREKSRRLADSRSGVTCSVEEGRSLASPPSAATRPAVPAGAPPHRLFVRVSPDMRRRQCRKQRAGSAIAPVPLPCGSRPAMPMLDDPGRTVGLQQHQDIILAAEHVNEVPTRDRLDRERQVERRGRTQNHEPDTSVHGDGDTVPGNGSCSVVHSCQPDKVPQSNPHQSPVTPLGMAIGPATCWRTPLTILAR